MEGYQIDIQALLQDIGGTYGDPAPTRPPRPSSRSISSSYKSQAECSMMPTDALAPIDRQQPLYEAQATRPSDAYSYSTYNDTGLDTYGSCRNLEIERRPAYCSLDQALLAEPQPQSRWQWQANSSMSTLPAGRLSLLGHTAPHSPGNVFQQSEAPKQRRSLSRGVLPMVHC